jgi:hypothetical protein
MTKLPDFMLRAFALFDADKTPWAVAGALGLTHAKASELREAWLARNEAEYRERVRQYQASIRKGNAA